MEKLTIKDMCDRISIEELAIRFGFAKDPAKSYRGGTVYEHPCGLLISITASRKYPGQQHYSNLNDDSDGGSLYTFVKNRIKDGIISVRSVSYRENEVVAKVLTDYLNLPSTDRESFLSKIPTKKTDAPFDFALGKMFMQKCINTTLLTQIRKIDKHTFTSDLFKGTFFNCNKEVDSRRRGSDLAFPCYRLDGTLGGINIRYYDQHKSKCGSMFFVGSEHDNSIWHSNIPDKIDQVFIGESEFDCMAHYQLRPNPNTLYISHQGNLIPGQVNAIIALLRKHSNRFTANFRMLLGADNDYQGSKYDLMLVSAAAASKSEATAKCYITECSSKPDYKAHMITVRQDLYEEFKSHCNCARMANNMRIDSYDDKCTIIVTRQRGDKYADDALSSIILSSGLVRNIVKEKAMTKDWNEDLKLLKSINAKIMNLKIEGCMSYELFREKFDELSLMTKSSGHLSDVLFQIKDRLYDDSKSVVIREQEEAQSQKSRNLQRAGFTAWK